MSITFSNLEIYERDKENVKGQGQGHRKVKHIFLKITLEQFTAPRRVFFHGVPRAKSLHMVTSIYVYDVIL